MQIEKLIIKGFRGFNKEQPIDLHPKLTLLYAPNSYGKTSISEALEWLLYEVTSKVLHADSKEEYKGSYRNCHSTDGLCFVEAQMKPRENKPSFKLKAELVKDDEIVKYLDDAKLEKWPFASEMEGASKPFVLQHALKYLLLVKPDERFQGFARLLGLDELDEIQRNIVSLCTKPEAKVPKEIAALLREIAEIEVRLIGQPEFKEIHKEFKKGSAAVNQIYSNVSKECLKKIPVATDEKSFVVELLRIREEMTSKIFDKQITLKDFSDEEKKTTQLDVGCLTSFITNEFIEDFFEIIKLTTLQGLIDKANFFGLGKKIYDDHPAKCPFCGQSINSEIEDHINKEHSRLMLDRERINLLEGKRKDVVDKIGESKRCLQLLHDRLIKAPANIVELKKSLDNLKQILIPKFELHYNVVENAITEFEMHLSGLISLHKVLLDGFEKIDEILTKSAGDIATVQKMSESVLSYLAEIEAYCRLITVNITPLQEANQVLKHELDLLAGTKDISVLIDLLDKRKSIEKGFKIKEIITGLKDLKSYTEQYVATKMLEAITSELSSDVMDWYNEIRTTGDPDVHFAGFDIERTKDGKFKSRRVQIKAKSYDKELVSAVSSLSESKLNALGLCVSIAANLKSNSPFNFLVIDDPIQSWDEEHETQFIEIIKKLITKGKQIILLSHNLSWINKVRSGCHSLNGRLYKINGYTKTGPDIQECNWIEYKERLKEINAIAQSSSISTIQLQQAEEEVRIVVTQIAAELYLKNKQIKVKPKNLNRETVRKILIESGIETTLVDRIHQTFETTDDAHHSPENYAAQKERIKRYHSWCHELAQKLES